jgi:hypothetical protein
MHFKSCNQSTASPLTACITAAPPHIPSHTAQQQAINGVVGCRPHKASHEQLCNKQKISFIKLHLLQQF